MAIRSIGIIGVGGVGGYFGGKLCRLLQGDTDVNISFIARGEHLQAIKRSGLWLSSETDGEVICKPSLVTDDFQLLPPLDLCLVCVKEFDLAGALSRLTSAITGNTIILPLLNGADVYSRVRAVIKQGIVLPACVYVGTHVERPGKVVQKGGACRILFGADPLQPEFSPNELISVFDRAGIRSEWTANIQAEIWRKFIFICAYGLVSAAHGKSLGEILDQAQATHDVRALMVEVALVAERSNISLPEDIVETSLAKAKTFPYEAKTSFQRDFEQLNKKDERDLFAGAMIRMADVMNIEIPKTKEVFALLERKKPGWCDKNFTKD